MKLTLNVLAAIVGIVWFALIVWLLTSPNVSNRDKANLILLMPD